MKIQILTEDNFPRVYALLRDAFPGSDYEVDLIQKMHQRNRPLHEWICIHTSKVIAYIAFSKAYDASDVCGLHLAPLAVAPDFQKQGVGSELLRFALRQEVIKHQTIFVLGEPEFYNKFGFELCITPLCPFDRNNSHFLSLRNTITTPFSIGYEPEFKTVAKPIKPKKGRGR